MASIEMSPEVGWTFKQEIGPSTLTLTLWTLDLEQETLLLLVGQIEPLCAKRCTGRTTSWVREKHKVWAES